MTENRLISLITVLHIDYDNQVNLDTVVDL